MESQLNERELRKRELEKIEGRAHGRFLVIKLKGLETPEAISAYTNAWISINREALPALEQGEYYWSDLIGLRVITNEGTELGYIHSLIETGSNELD